MSKKILVILCLISILFTSAGCTAAWDSVDTAQQDQKISTDFERIDGYENLYYCKNTDIVYWIGGSYQVNLIGYDYTTSYMTVYYAPNGLPYRFNKRLGTLESIPTGGNYDNILDNNYYSASTDADHQGYTKYNFVDTSGKKNR